MSENLASAIERLKAAGGKPAESAPAATPETLDRLQGLVTASTQYRLGQAMQRVEAAANKRANAGEDYPTRQVAAVRGMYTTRTVEAMKGCADTFVRGICRLLDGIPNHPPPAPPAPPAPERKPWLGHPCNEDMRATGRCSRYA